MVHGSLPVVLLTALSVVNFAVLILARGVLLGAHALRAYSALLVGEAVVRVVLLAVLVLLDVEAAVPWAVLATVVGSLVWIGAIGRLAHSVDWSGARTPWSTVTGTVTALGVANGLSALVLTGFPAVAVAILGKSPDLAVLIALITLARAPLALLAPVQALTVPTVVRWSRSGDTRHLTRALEYIAGGSAVAALVGAAVGYSMGPWAIALVLGDDYRPAGGDGRAGGGGDLRDGRSASPGGSPGGAPAVLDGHDLLGRGDRVRGGGDAPGALGRGGAWAGRLHGRVDRRVRRDRRRRPLERDHVRKRRAA